MKKVLVLLFATLSLNIFAQGYKITFHPQTPKEGSYYIGQHFRDQFIIIDSSNMKDGNISFYGKKNLGTGVYVLLNSQKKKMFDFMIDGSSKFSITFDESFSNSGMKVKGSDANRLMFEFMAKQDWAKNKVKGGLDKEAMDELTIEMNQFEESYMKKYSRYRFTQLVSMFQSIDVPDQLPSNTTDTNLQEWQQKYYRNHFWDKIDLKDHSLIYTPHLFEKMNYYFFGLLYYQHSDTITRCAERLFNRMEGDSVMLRYFLDFITPKYERSTKNVGWDQVFVNLVQNYYLQNKCPWATPADIYNKRKTVQYLSHSLIGAMGQELFMSDSNQNSDPRTWISSHRFPQKYVILWFWDPDCHHCQEQSAELANLMDSLKTVGQKPFEVYAVGFESDVNKWKKYLSQHHMPFVNVGGVNVNIDYQEAYNVHGAPTMIILDPDRRIIMNKVLPVNNILPFLKRYEEEHPEMKDKQTRWMMYQRK